MEISIVFIVVSNCIMIQKTKKFRFWNDSNNYELIIVDNVLFVYLVIPYSFKWIQIVDMGKNEVYSKLYMSDGCKCQLDICYPGKYYLYFFGSDNGIIYDYFLGGKQIVLEQDNNNQWHFLLPMFTSWNRELIKTGKLNYILCETLLDNQHTMIRAANNLTSKCRSIHDKVLVIHDFVANNIYYDYDALSSCENTNRTIEQIVSEKKGVCQGYADLTLVLLKSVGIYAENILCYAICDIMDNGWSLTTNRTADLNHIITRVKLEERWLYMDVTWDSNNKFEHGKYIKGNKVSHRYFDVTLPFLSSTHRFFKK